MYSPEASQVQTGFMHVSHSQMSSLGCQLLILLWKRQMRAMALLCVNNGVDAGQVLTPSLLHVLFPPKSDRHKKCWVGNPLYTAPWWQNRPEPTPTFRDLRSNIVILESQICSLKVV